MIEESAQVVKVEGEVAWVETQRRSGCASCSSEKGCSTSAMNKLVNPKPLRVRVRNSLGAAVGDRVVIGLEDAALVRSSMVVYLLPLVTLIGAALLTQLAGGSEGWVALAGIAGLAMGFLAVRAFGRRVADDPLYQAVILRHGDGLPLQFLKK